ncbi:hypothetical protein ACOME3_001779 [Neoechinorhynchus agilis]
MQVETQKNPILQVSVRQRGNPLLKQLQSVPWQYNDKLIPDYELKKNACALFLSLKFHLLRWTKWNVDLLRLIRSTSKLHSQSNSGVTWSIRSSSSPGSM